MKRIWILGFVCLTLLGCQAIDQARKDAQVGLTLPTAPGEKTPQEKGLAVGEKIAPLIGAAVNSVAPGAGAVAAPVALIIIVGIATWLYGWRKGKKYRLQNQAASEHPITGTAGQAVGAEAVVQHLADVSAGIFNAIGAQGSALNRFWKMTLLPGLALLLVPEIQHVVLPYLQNSAPGWLQHIAGGTILSLTIGGVAAVEKALSKVLPITLPTTTGPSV